MQKISKDFIKFRQHIRTLNLSINEQYLLELLFEFQNYEYGYCFLKITDILKAFNTTSKNIISTVIKSLEEKGLITVDRENKNNRYFINDINNFINVSDAADRILEALKKHKKIRVDSNGEKPLEGQVTVEETIKINEKLNLVNEVITVGKASSELQEVIETKSIEEIKEIIEDVKSNNNGLVTSKYILNAFMNIDQCNVIQFRRNYTSNNSKGLGEINPLSFNNFKAREYDYDDLERKLLGWE